MTTPNSDHDRLPPSPERDDAFAMLAAGIVEPPRCECRCHLSPIPHGDGRCERPASKHVACHLWGECDHPENVLETDIDPDGNLCTVMCQRCAELALVISERRIAAVIDHTPPHATPCCPTCNRPTVTAADICEIRAMP